MNGYLESFNKYKGLLGELVKKGIKLKYRRSYLGIIWTLLEPILTTAVLVFVFQNLFGKDDVRGVAFAVYILTGRLLYSCFSSSTNAALRSIRANSGLIKKVYVPKYLYPLSAILFNFIIFAISLIVLILGCIIFKVTPTWHIIEALVPLFLLFLFVLGCGMILSTIAVFFRDMEYLWNVLSMLVMYASAIFYDAEKIFKQVKASGEAYIATIFKCNPLYQIIDMFRDTVLYGKGINYAGVGFIYTLCVCIGLVLVGFFAFYKKQDEFILHI
ncbi:MAG: ABC transporter permease [Clostridia bacterium]|nr:ABC transporter permease [Clostridia bacterium]